jgi:hypothetical protein
MNKLYWLNPISGKYGVSNSNGQSIDIGYLSEYRYCGQMNVKEKNASNMTWTRKCHFLIEE